MFKIYRQHPLHSRLFFSPCLLPAASLPWADEGTPYILGKVSHVGDCIGQVVILERFGGEGVERDRLPPVAKHDEDDSTYKQLGVHSRQRLIMKISKVSR